MAERNHCEGDSPAQDGRPSPGAARDLSAAVSQGSARGGARSGCATSGHSAARNLPSVLHRPHRRTVLRHLHPARKVLRGVLWIGHARSGHAS
eukprot:7375950-Prymnesium_polylepis.3